MHKFAFAHVKLLEHNVRFDNLECHSLMAHPTLPCAFHTLAFVQAKLLEHNVRFGDPECQSLMARLDSDLGDAMLQAATGKLDQVKLDWNKQAAVTVVMAANGYPGSYKKGTVIRGLESVTGAKVWSGVECGAVWGVGRLQSLWVCAEVPPPNPCSDSGTRPERSCPSFRCFVLLTCRPPLRHPPALSLPSPYSLSAAHS